MLFMLDLTKIVSYIFYVSIPLFILYIAYLFVTRAFKEMGFSSLEALIIVFVSFILGRGILNSYIGINLSSIYLFSYQNWIVSINTGGALIPIILSIYLSIKNKIPPKKILIGIATVSIIAFLVTTPVENKGIVSNFPFWILPALIASLSSVFLLRKKTIKAVSQAYVSGTIGVLIGADFLHLPELLSFTPTSQTNAMIGGAIVFDMVFLTGLIAVILDGIFLYQKKSQIS